MRTTDSSILQDTDLAGPLVFVLALGGFLLLVCLDLKKKTVLNLFSLKFILERESNLFIHLWNWSFGLFSILVSSLVHGYTSKCYNRSCNLSFGLLSITNGSAIWFKCYYINAVSLFNVKCESLYFLIHKKMFSLRGVFGIVLAGFCIVWCAVSASKLFVTAYSMDHQQILIAYPCALLYGVFALITIF